MQQDPNIQKREKGRIVIDVDGVLPGDTDRYRKIIIELISRHAFDVRNGKIVVHFADGQYKGFDFDMPGHRVNKPDDPFARIEALLAKIEENVKIKSEEAKT